MPTVCIVADDPVRAADLVGALGGEGFTCQTVRRPDEVSDRTDLILLAVNDTESAFDHCRQMSAAPGRAPTVIHGGAGDPADVVRGLACGAAGVVPFDLTPDELGRRLRRILCRPRRTTGAMRSIELAGEVFTIADDGARLCDELVAALEDLGRTKDRFAAELVQRWRAEEEALRSRERFELAVRGSGDGIWDWDVRTNEVYFSPRWKEMIGHSDDEIGPTFNEWASRLHPDDQERAVRTIEAYLDGRLPAYELEHRLRHKDGTYRWILARGVALRDGEGRPYRMAGSHTDLSARKTFESELRRAREAAENAHRLLDSILQNVADGIVVADQDGKFIHFNTAAEQILGVGATDVGVDQWTARYGVFRPDGVTPCPPHELPLARTMRGEEVTDVELFIRNARRPYGVWISVNGRPWRDQAGEQRGGVIVFRDVTERKRAEAELRRATAAAEAASQAKSEFLANMSHEIRTPMNAIIGMAELLADTELAPDQREYLDMVRRSADALLGLIDDILDFSKVEAGKLDLEEVDFALRDSLADTLTTLSLRAYQKGLELAYHVAADVPDHLAGDPNRLRQVVMNLVGNAIKFSEEGEVVVTVDRAADGGSDGLMLHFAVRDTGIGIPADKQAAIFDAFTQADSSTTRRYGGTGLGLAISSRIVRMMGGRIWVDSAVGAGSTFHFTARFRPGRHPPPGRPNTEAARLAGLRVLVVDDNETNRRILRDILTQWQMRPELADGAEKAVAALDRAGPDGFAFTLLDAHMPGTDGFDLARTIRARPDSTAGKLLMLTSGGQPGDAARCQELGFAAYFPKPVRQADLWRALIRALDVSPETPAPVPGLPPRRATRPLRILVAEDNPMNQTLAVRLLEKRGHAVAVANNGREALDRLFGDAGTPFDLVLMDVQMPEMDGLEAAAEIRRREAPTGRHIPIVAMTAHAMKGDEGRCLAAGMDDYVAKPVKPDALFAVLDRLGGAGRRTGRPVEPPRWVASPTALEHVNGDVELLRELAGVFVAEWPRWRAELRDGLARADSARVRRIAHSLKGALGTLAVEPARSLAQELEASAAAGRPGDPRLLERLERGVAELLPPLERFATDGGPGGSHGGFS